MGRSSQLNDSPVGSFRILYTPISNRAVSFRGAGRVCGLQTKFVAADVKANVERFIEIWREAKHLSVPGFAFGNVVNVIDGGA
jgi:hypothetical protein